jgi:hypothetical protein
MRIERGDITIETPEIKFIGDYYDQLYTNTSENKGINT